MNPLSRSPLLLLLVVTSCASRPQPAVVLQPSPPPAASVEAVRQAEVVRPYHLGRYADPNHPDVMHEQHSLYRVEATARWNLKPGRGSGPILLNPPPDAAYSPSPTSDAIAAELQRQKEVTERVLREATQMARSHTNLQQLINDMTAVAKSHSVMVARISEAERRLKEMELERRVQNVTPATPSNSLQDSTINVEFSPFIFPYPLPAAPAGSTNFLPPLRPPVGPGFP